MLPRALQKVGFTVSFVHSNGQYPCSASQQEGKNLSHNFLLISAMHPFKTRGRFLFCSCAQRSGENTVRQQGLAGSELQTTCVVLLVHLHDQPHFPPAPHPLIAAGNALSTSTAPGSSQEMSWEGQSNLARPDPAHGLPRHSLDRGYSSFCCTDNTQQAVTQILIVHSGEKQPPSGHKRKNMYGHSWPNMCFVWSATLPRKMWHSAKKPRHSNKTL